MIVSHICVLCLGVQRVLNFGRKIAKLTKAAQFAVETAKHATTASSATGRGIPQVIEVHRAALAVWFTLPY